MAWSGKSLRTLWTSCQFNPGYTKAQEMAQHAEVTHKLILQQNSPPDFFPTPLLPVFCCDTFQQKFLTGI